MALPATGPLTFSSINIELGLPSTTPISMGSTAVRTLYGVPSGPLRLASDGYGKASTSWDLANAYYNPPASLCWDGRTAVVTTPFAVATQDTNPTGIFFKPDGSKFYTVGSANDRVYEYDMAANHKATFVRFFSIAPEEILGTSVSFSPDGIYMYVIGTTGDDVNQYTLSTAWNISTAVYTRVSTATIAEGTMQGMFFKPDGTALYTVGNTLNTIRQYSLSSAWNVSTLAFVRSFSLGTVAPFDVFFDPTGIKMRVLSDYGTAGQFISYTLSTAWDISSASLDFVRPTTPALADATPQGAFFESTGRHVFVVGSTATAQVYPYALGGFDISAKETSPTSVAFSSDGTKMYVYGSTSDAVHQYTLSVAWDVSTAVFLQSFGIADGAPSGFFFGSDGTKLYSIGASNVREHTLSTAWNVSTAAFVQARSMAFTTGETQFTGMYIDSTGTRVYTIGSGLDKVYQYSLSTAWNISTASYIRTISISAQDTVPQDVFFKPDGKTMYILAQVGGIGVSPALVQYTLSVAWDISTATYTKFKATETEEITSTGFFFRPDGNGLYIIGSKQRVFQYTIGI